MSPELKEIEEKALNLSASDRETLANHLFQSVHNQELSELETEWIALAEERFAALASGSDPGLSEEEFFRGFVRC